MRSLLYNISLLVLLVGSSIAQFTTVVSVVLDASAATRITTASSTTSTQAATKTGSDNGVATAYDIVYATPAAASSARSTSSTWQSKRTAIIIVVAAIGGLIVLAIVIALLARAMKIRKDGSPSSPRKSRWRRRNKRRTLSDDTELQSFSASRFEHGMGRRVNIDYQELFGLAPPERSISRASQAAAREAQLRNREIEHAYFLTDPESGAEADIEASNAIVTAQRSPKRASSDASSNSGKKRNVLRKKPLKNKVPIPSSEYLDSFDPMVEYAGQDLDREAERAMRPFSGIYDIQDPRWRYPVYPIKEESILIEEEESGIGLGGLPRPTLSDIQDSSGTLEVITTDEEQAEMVSGKKRPSTPLGFDFAYEAEDATKLVEQPPKTYAERIREANLAYAPVPQNHSQQDLRSSEESTFRYGNRNFDNRSISGESVNLLTVPAATSWPSLHSRSSNSTNPSVSSRFGTPRSGRSYQSSGAGSTLSLGASSQGDDPTASLTNLSPYSPFDGLTDTGYAYDAASPPVVARAISPNYSQQVLQRTLPIRPKLQNFSLPSQTQTMRPMFPPVQLGPAKPQYQRLRSLTDPSPGEGPSRTSASPPGRPLARQGANRRRSSMSSSPTASPRSTQPPRLSSLSPISAHSHPLSGPLPEPRLAKRRAMSGNEASSGEDSDLRREFQRQQRRNSLTYRQPGQQTLSEPEDSYTPRPYVHHQRSRSDMSAASTNPLLNSQDVTDAMSSTAQQQRPSMRRYSYMTTPPPRKPVPPQTPPYEVPSKKKQKDKKKKKYSAPLWTPDGYFDYIFTSESESSGSSRAARMRDRDAQQQEKKGKRPKRPIRRSTDLESPVFWAQTPARSTPRRIA